MLVPHCAIIFIVEGIGYVRALYDYQAEGEDEISFNEGQIFPLLSRDENG